MERPALNQKKWRARKWEVKHIVKTYCPIQSPLKSMTPWYKELKPITWPLEVYLGYTVPRSTCIGHCGQKHLGLGRHMGRCMQQRSSAERRRQLVDVAVARRVPQRRWQPGASFAGAQRWGIGPRATSEAAGVWKGYWSFNCSPKVQLLRSGCVPSRGGGLHLSGRCTQLGSPPNMTLTVPPT